MKIPPIASFPPSTLRGNIVPEEWEACVDAWTTLVAIHLRLPVQEFISISANDDSLAAFLVSYVYEMSRRPGSEDRLNGFKARLLWRECFRLAHRFLSGNRIPQPLLDWTFLADLSSIYLKSIDLRKLFGSLWDRHAMRLEPGFQELRRSLVGDLEKVSSDKSEDLASTLRRIEPLLYVSQDISRFFMVGSDFLDALFSGYMNASEFLRRKILAVTYLGLISLLEEVPNLSLLLDHLYGLKNLVDIEEKRGQNTRTLVLDLVTNTPLIRKLRSSIGGTEAARAKSLINSLETFRDPKERRYIRLKTNKGKGRATEDDNGEIYAHRMSLVTQIQDLFPDLGWGFIVRLLDEYSDNVELVTTHLLEGSLPPHLRDADRTKELSASSEETNGNPVSLSTPPIPSAFDNDAFDNLAIEPSRIHIGRKNQKQTADSLLSDRSTAPNKTAILSALAAFDLDDDERDDTYDVEDIGGAVDSAGPAGDSGTELQDESEEALFRAYKHDPRVFLRDSATRLGKSRLALKNETGMTDEVIEGWGIMLERDPRRLKKLEAKYMAPSRAQRGLLPTSDLGNMVDSGTEESDRACERGASEDMWRRGKGVKGRGDVAGPAGEDAQTLRRRKEAKKGPKANHNRRDRRAHKMARGGFSA
ncbi:hypothetical protein GP486_000213 [Trichoglossum hirsutum]|uniref:CUE domain-containing protein n=1 Tax=Trichoglossum hirsutum TaxID=265104 RepID=A0A9P8LJ02_9PEZI|nr:hypothetical protein GP486_000213 [Trichoglossum hirsutum]